MRLRISFVGRMGLFDCQNQGLILEYFWLKGMQFYFCSSGENLSCVIVFVMVYYFLMAACVWFVILTYAWHLRFKTLGKFCEKKIFILYSVFLYSSFFVVDKIQTRLDKKAAYFHLVAWSLPSVLTIVVMAFSEIDGNFTSGICFVGYTNRTARLVFVVVPVLTCAMIGAYFLFRGECLSFKKTTHKLIACLIFLHA